MTTTGSIAVLLATLGLAAGLDQASKRVARRRLVDEGFRPLARGFGFRLSFNQGGGLLAVSPVGALGIWVAALAGSGLVLGAGASSLGVAAVIGLGLALGGAAGNLADRIVRSAVVDFIALSHWPTFKLADAAMVAGGGLIAWSLI
jgi:signal peptidase II